MIELAFGEVEANRPGAGPGQVDHPLGGAAAQFEDVTASDVAEHVRQKLIRRHPHVFGDAAVDTATDMTAPPDMTFEEASKIMLDKGFRHLPVVDGETILGIVSLRRIMGGRRPRDK
jgi:CBS domain-containing protein